LFILCRDEERIDKWFETTRSTLPHPEISSSRHGCDPSSENTIAATRRPSTSADRRTHKKSRPRSPRPPLAPVLHPSHHDKAKPSSSQYHETLSIEYIIHNATSPLPIPETQPIPVIALASPPGRPFIRSSLTSNQSLIQHPESVPLFARTRSPSLGYIPTTFPLRLFVHNEHPPGSYRDPARDGQSQNQSYFVPLGPSFPTAIFPELANCSLSDHLSVSSNSLTSIAPYPPLPVAFQARLEDIMASDRRIDNSPKCDITAKHQGK
jgi:hypothetical protein